MTAPYPRPTREQLLAARGRTTPDLLAPGLRVVFCGINPSLYSAVVGHHFARPGNRFWPALHGGRFTSSLLQPWEGDALLASGCGITNIYERATATAAELSADELRQGAERLRVKIEALRPRVLAVLGVTAFRDSFSDRQAGYGLQEGLVGDSRVWVLPNPSGLNAHFQLPALTEKFRKLREFVEEHDYSD